MTAPCLDPRQFLAACRGETLGNEAQQHLESCNACREELAQMRHLSVLLTNLGRAEQSAPLADRLWAGLETHLDAPGLLTRLPLPLAGLSRLTRELVQPRAAAAWVVGVVGLLLGIYLAPRGSAAPPEEPYTWSSLVEDRISLSAVYESSFPVEGNGVDAANVHGDDSDGTGATPVSGGRP